jgi:hypothetical protein
MRINPKQNLLLVTLASASLAVTSAQAVAASRKPVKKKAAPTEVVYRCKDANGQSYFGQNIPPECMEADIEVLDDTGRVVRVIPGRQSLEVIEAQRAAEAARKENAQRDRTLLATYLSVADIERLRDQRLELLVQQAHVTEQYIANLRERESRLVDDVQRYRPYSSAPKAPVLPDHVAEDIVNTVNGLQVYEQELAKNTMEQQQLRSEFDSDIARFKQLKGIK